MFFARTTVYLNFAGTTSGKQGQQFLYKLMAQDNDRSPLQMNTTGQGPRPLQMNTKLLGQQSGMLVSEPQFLIFHNEMLTIETTVSSANL